MFICCNIFSTNLFIHVGSEKNSFTLTRSHHVVVKWRLLWSMMSSACDCKRENKWGNNWTNSAYLGCVYRLMENKKCDRVKNCEKFSSGNHSCVKCLIHHHICCPISSKNHVTVALTLRVFQSLFKHFWLRFQVFHSREENFRRRNKSWRHIGFVKKREKSWRKRKNTLFTPFSSSSSSLERFRDHAHSNLTTISVHVQRLFTFFAVLVQLLMVKNSKKCTPGGRE